MSLRIFKCSECGEEKNTFSTTKVVCSPRCAQVRHNRKRRIANGYEPGLRAYFCAQCGKPGETMFRNQKYCSDKCNNDATYEKHKVQQVARMQFARYVLGIMERRVPDQIVRLRKAFEERRNADSEGGTTLGHNG